jgi:hypothetical protein
MGNLPHIFLHANPDINWFNGVAFSVKCYSLLINTRPLRAQIIYVPIALALAGELGFAAETGVNLTHYTFSFCARSQMPLKSALVTTV